MALSKKDKNSIKVLAKKLILNTQKLGYLSERDYQNIYMKGWDAGFKAAKETILKIIRKG